MMYTDHIKTQKYVIFIKKKLKVNTRKKKYCKLEIIVIIQGNIELLCIIYVT